MARYARIIIDLHHQKVDRVYTYLVSEALSQQIEEGMLVEVPFGMGNRSSQGYVIELTEEAEFPEQRLKQIRKIISPEPVFSKSNLELAKKMQERYYAPLSACLALFVPKIPSFADPVVEKVRLLRMPQDEYVGKGQRQFLTCLAKSEEEGVTLRKLRQTAPISKASLLSLVQKGYVDLYEESEGKPPTAFVSLKKSKPLPLNAQQLAVRTQLEQAIEQASAQGFLLHGITGSGKTEIYMQCIQKVLDLGKQTILLVPEISLTPQLVRVFTERFGDVVGITHSRMTDRERSLQWRLAKRGDYRVMIGPRSALFTPFTQLGLIIIDEEHESSYKSEQQAPHYHAREVAKMLCEQQSCPFLLGSATPSIESYFEAQQGNLTLLTLTQRAVQTAVLPQIELIDMRAELEAGHMSVFCRALIQAIREKLQKKEQIILFLNRKGYATFVSCRKCGFVLNCPRCYLPYTYHKDQDKLICHHCGKEAELPSVCPECGSPYIRQFGAGTQRIQEEAVRFFPEARILRMDMGTMRNREDYIRVYDQFLHHEGDILIGTQMIAKGFDFPGVTLVGVLAADMTLYSTDYHSTERTFQLITQVAGRAGRAEKRGQVFVQTYSPDHYCIQKAQEQDYEGFYQKELAARKIMECPPFTHLAEVLLTGTKEEVVVQGARRLGMWMEHYAKGREIEVLGPSPASLGRINNVFRWKLLVKCREERRLRAFTKYCCDRFMQEEKRVTVFTDIDPVTIL